MKKLALCCLATALSLVAAGTASATFTLTLQQVGNDVVVSGSGTLDTTALSLVVNNTNSAQIRPARGVLLAGPLSSTALSFYGGGGFSGPTVFGTGGLVGASSGSGNLAGVNGLGATIAVPQGYVSGASLADSATFAGQTFASLGFTPGTYTYTWGSGVNADSLRVIGIVPEPSTWVLFGSGMVGVGVVALHRRRTC